MKAETLFQVCNSIAPAGWLLMLVAPRWRWTQRIVLSGVFPLALALVYLLLIVIFFGDLEGDFGSLSGVAKLFEDPFALTAGWIHYLAFDMFIGAWELSDSHKHGIPHYWMLLPLVLTFMFGPIGLVVYFLVLWNRTKKFLHDA